MPTATRKQSSPATYSFYPHVPPSRKTQVLGLDGRVADSSFALPVTPPTTPSKPQQARRPTTPEGKRLVLRLHDVSNTSPSGKRTTGARQSRARLSYSSNECISTDRSTMSDNMLKEHLRTVVYDPSTPNRSPASSLRSRTSSSASSEKRLTGLRIRGYSTPDHYVNHVARHQSSTSISSPTKARPCTKSMPSQTTATLTRTPTTPSHRPSLEFNNQPLKAAINLPRKPLPTKFTADSTAPLPSSPPHCSSPSTPMSTPPSATQPLLPRDSNVEILHSFWEDSDDEEDEKGLVKMMKSSLRLSGRDRTDRKTSLASTLASTSALSPSTSVVPVKRKKHNERSPSVRERFSRVMLCGCVSRKG